MSEAGVDQNTFDELVEIMGDDMPMLIGSYISDSKEKLLLLKTLHPTNDSDAIFRLVHSLKGSSRNIGVIEFSNYCESIEENARNDALDDANYDCEKLNVLFENAVLMINRKML